MTIAESASEDVCRIPDGMRRFVIPRRGGVAEGEARTLASGAAARYEARLAESAPTIEAILADEQSDAELVAEFRAARGLSEATPPGAAVGAALLVHQHSEKALKDFPDLVDAWVATRGAAFAVATLVELFGVAVSNGYFTSSGHIRSDNLTPVHVHRQVSVWKAQEANHVRFALAARMRTHLAAASEEEYAAAVDVLAKYRAAATASDLETFRQRALMSFLTPERTEWVDEDIAAYVRDHHDQLSPWLLFCAVSTEDQAADFGRSGYWWTLSQEPRAVWTAVDGAGSALLPALTALVAGYIDADGTQRLLSLIALLPTDAAFQTLVDGLDKKYYTAAVLAAAKEFPRRALRILADAARHDGPKGQAAANVLRLHTLAYADIAQAELGNLGPAARGLVEEILATNVRVPDAEPESLPPVLVSPPWLSGRKAAKPVVLAGLTAPTETVMTWRDGELEDWAARPLTEYAHWRRSSWDDTIKQIEAGTDPGWYHGSRFFLLAPEEQARPLLSLWEPVTWQSEEWGPRLVARFGADALPQILRLARAQPATCSHLLAPFDSPEAALLAADWLARLKSARPYAMAWLKRHPTIAARTLIPVALGKAGKARAAAELTLRALAANGFADTVAEAAQGYGAAASEAIAVMIADDGTLALPKTMPEVPAWADAAVLPQVLLKGRRDALPIAATGHLVMMLAVSPPGEPYAGVVQTKAVCDPASLAAFAWALFQNWKAAEYPSKQNWAFDALRWFGDDDTVRRLSPMIRVWPGEGGHSRAVAGLDVLAGIGGDTALMHLYGISQKAKFKGLKERAVDRVTEIADDLGLTAEQLGDRLVPDLGLDASGSLTLDYGPRRFTVGFDEQLKPYVADESGKRLKALPKPGAKDDAELGPAAYQRFSGLKKDVRTLAADQIARLELGMVAQRRWTAQEFKDYFVVHPLLRHIVRRLVWATFADDGTFQTAFRVAEDLSFADVSEDEYGLADDASVGIAHPLHLGADLAAWAEVFADYEILQPFAQLGRPVHRLTDEERTATDLTRFDGADVPVGKVLGLERRGWRRGAPQDAGIQGWIFRPLPDGRYITVDLDPGIAVGYVNEFGQTQHFQGIYISDDDNGRWFRRKDDGPKLSTLDDVTASEILRDLTEVTAK